MSGCDLGRFGVQLFGRQVDGTLSRDEPLFLPLLLSFPPAAFSSLRTSWESEGLLQKKKNEGLLFLTKEVEEKSVTVMLTLCQLSPMIEGIW